MKYKIIINNDIEKTYGLVSWDVNSFNVSLTLMLESTNFDDVSNDFSDIKNLDVFCDDKLVASYTNLNTYDEIVFIKNQYVSETHTFTDALRVHLTKTDIISQIERINEKVNPIIDIGSMTLGQLKEYQIKEIGKACREDIYAGDDIMLPSGTVKHYTYNADDQANILSAITLAFAAKQMGFDLDYIPYHASGQACELLDTESMVLIYMTLQLRLTRLTTKCNMLNCMINDKDTKDGVMSITWHTDLSARYQQQYDEIVNAATEVAEAMAQAMQPNNE